MSQTRKLFAMAALPSRKANEHVQKAREPGHLHERGKGNHYYAHVILDYPLQEGVIIPPLPLSVIGPLLLTSCPERIPTICAHELFGPNLHYAHTLNTSFVAICYLFICKSLFQLEESSVLVQAVDTRRSPEGKDLNDVFILPLDTVMLCCTLYSAGVELVEEYSETLHLAS